MFPRQSLPLRNSTDACPDICNNDRTELLERTGVLVGFVLGLDERATTERESICSVHAKLMGVGVVASIAAGSWQDARRVRGPW